VGHLVPELKRRCCMALVKCGECGKEISDQAPKCPHCGVEKKLPSAAHELGKSFSKKRRIGWIILLCIVAGGIGIYYFVTRSQNSAVLGGISSSQVIAEKAPFFCSAPGHETLSYNVPREGLLTVSVIEQSGKNIEFEIANNGKRIYASGVQKGTAFSTGINVDAGTITVIVQNGNFAEEKSGFVTVRINYW
jgi:hypothetical protein